MQTKSTRSQDMHKYIFLMLGAFMLIVVSYPVSFLRVSQEKKFDPYNSHLKSLTPEYKPSKPVTPVQKP
ncbi:hypothetical protein [Brunnivagina elsteri]|uniref:hypothetical protein n=1 Tax=Brunnivagina elsteri TaxID=1247191 RepID=UPI0011778AD0|nr:hypothetical protein [Calothrix elsteri]